MTKNDVNMGAPTPHDTATDGLSGSADTTVDQDDDIVPNLDPFLDGLAGDEGSKEAKSLREWITEDKCTGQGLEMKDRFGRTPLHVAATRGLSAAATKFIRDGATLNAKDLDGETALHAACDNGHGDIVELLLGAGADTTVTNQAQRTPLYVAAYLGYESIVQLLCKNPGKDLDIQENFVEWTPLHTAAFDGKKTIVRYLKDAGARLDLQDEDGWTPLMTAVVKEEEDVLKILLEGLEHGDKSLEIEDSEGRTPLLKAAQESFWEGARLLVMAGAKCDKSKDSQAIDTDSTLINPRQGSALHLAVSANQFEMVRLLLDKGANVNALNDEGKHSSHLASSKGNEGILKLLLDAKDSKGLDARDDDGMTPLHFAGCTGEDLDKKSDMEDSAADGQTDDNARKSQPGRYTQVVRLLLERNADTKVFTKNNKTALELALDYGHTARGETIFNSMGEEDLDKIVPAGDAVQDHLLWASSNTNRHMIAIFIFKGKLRKSGNQFPKTSEGWTAIEWASYMKNPDALWFLIASSPQSKETKKALECAKSLVESKVQPVLNSWSRGLNDGEDTTKKRGKEENLVQDILNNPPTGLICEDSQTYSLPRLGGTLFESLEQSTASIVQFYKEEGRFGSIIRSRTVKDTIYSDGPKKIMDDVVRGLKSLAEDKIGQHSPAPIFMDSTPKFTWIHLPATNMTWMDHLLQRIMKDEDRSISEFNQAKSFLKDSWIEINEPVQQVSDGSQNNENQEKGRENEGRKATPSVAATATYMPYFSYSFQLRDGYDDSKQAGKAEKPPTPHKMPDTRKTKVKDPKSARPAAGNNEIAEPEVVYAKNLFEKRQRYEALLEEYKDKIVHGSSTLDESYYHFGEDESSLKDRKRRNESQVVTYSWLKDEKLGSYWPLIRVNQLWIWTIDDKWLLSASSHPIDDSENELLHGILDLLEKQGEASGSGLQPSSVSEMSQFIVDYCARDETELFEKLRTLTEKMRTVSSLKDRTKDSQGQSLDEQLTKATMEAEELSKTVKDILDELNILEGVANYQQDVQRSMKVMKAMKKQEIQSSVRGMKKDKVPETDLSATYIISDISRLESVAKRVHDAVNTTLSLQQSEVANLQARLSMQQGRVLMVFTVVTIVFVSRSLPSHHSP
ncbi:hypothetical protein E8E14_013975 [Neopestalotiopsis sp. 37M]|nr:hypothetical protein E8E14_013975 [Neopestalotiopsis sp. 37M]